MIYKQIFVFQMILLLSAFMVPGILFAGDADTVELATGQLNAVKIESVGTYSFPVEKEAVGSVAYGDNASTETRAADGPQVKWVVANVSESDCPFINVGQPVEVKLMAYPGRVFRGSVSSLGGTVWDAGGSLAGGKPAVDPNTHRIIARCKVSDPKNELYPGMLATIVIQIQQPVESVAIPMNGVVRNSDGTMAVWVTADRKHFSQRIIEVGLQRDGKYQVLKALRRGELAVTDGAVFLSNMLNAPPED